jgi:hypothetical protein
MKMESTLPEALNVFIRLSEVTLDWSEKPKKPMKEFCKSVLSHLPSEQRQRYREPEWP